MKFFTNFSQLFFTKKFFKKQPKPCTDLVSPFHSFTLFFTKFCENFELPNIRKLTIRKFFKKIKKIFFQNLSDKKNFFQKCTNIFFMWTFCEIFNFYFVKVCTNVDWYMFFMYRTCFNKIFRSFVKIFIRFWKPYVRLYWYMFTE